MFVFKSKGRTRKRFLSVDRSFKLNVERALPNDDSEVSCRTSPFLMNDVPDGEGIEGERHRDVSGGSWVEVDSFEASKDGGLSSETRSETRSRGDEREETEHTGSPASSGKRR